NLTIQGQTTVNCTGTAGTSNYACTATDNTIIQDSYLSSNPLLIITTSSGMFRMTGLTIQGGAATSPKNPAVIQISGSSNPNFRLDHSHLRVDDYSSGTYMDFMRVFNLYGVIDHSIFNLAGTGNGVDVFNGSGSDGYGDGVWASSSDLSGGNYLFLEDNIFTSGMISDCAWAGRIVVRYNTSTNQSKYSATVHN